MFAFNPISNLTRPNSHGWPTDSATIGREIVHYPTIPHDWLLNFKVTLLKRKINIRILIAPMKTLTNSKNWSGMQQHNYCSGFSLCHWLIFSSVDTSLDAFVGKIAALAHLKGVLLGGNFIEAGTKFSTKYHDSKQFKNFNNNQRTYKNTILI